MKNLFKSTEGIVAIVILILLLVIIMSRKQDTRESYDDFIKRTSNPEGFTAEQYKIYRK